MRHIVLGIAKFHSYFYYLVYKKGGKTVAKCGDITCGRLSKINRNKLLKLIKIQQRLLLRGLGRDTYACLC